MNLRVRTVQLFSAMIADWKEDLQQYTHFLSVLCSCNSYQCHAASLPPRKAG